MIIIKKKYYSDNSNKSKKEKYETKTGRRARHTLSAMTGTLTGVGLGTGLIVKNMKDYLNKVTPEEIKHRSEIENLQNQYNKTENNILNKHSKIYNKIMEDKKMSNYGKASSLNNLNKATRTLQFINRRGYDKNEQLLKDNYNKLIKKLKKNRNKKVILSGLLGLGAGTAVGLGVDNLIKLRQDKLGIKRK